MQAGFLRTHVTSPASLLPHRLEFIIVSSFLLSATLFSHGLLGTHVDDSLPDLGLPIFTTARPIMNDEVASLRTLILCR